MKKTHCEWCGHEFANKGADVPRFYYDGKDIPRVLCASCFHETDVREKIENIIDADIEFFGEYEEDDF